VFKSVALVVEDIYSCILDFNADAEMVVDGVIVIVGVVVLVVLIVVLVVDDFVGRFIL